MSFCCFFQNSFSKSFIPWKSNNRFLTFTNDHNIISSGGKNMSFFIFQTDQIVITIEFINMVNNSNSSSIVSINYESDIAEIVASGATDPKAALALAELPLQIKGFGPVKEANRTKAMEDRAALLAAIRGDAKADEAA